MNRNNFFAPWSELKNKLSGTNADILEVVMYCFERIITIALAGFTIAAGVFQSRALGSVFLFTVSWLGGLYLAVLLLFQFFKPKK